MDRVDRRALLRSSDTELLSQCKVDLFRASGPGGQKRNKTESAVRLRHEPTALAARAVESRSQRENRARALRRLREKIAHEIREVFDLETRSPPEDLLGFIGRGAGAKTRRSGEYLLAIAELLDLLVAHEQRLGDTARYLGVSTGALSRFVVSDELLHRTVNRYRTEAGLRPLSR